MRVHRLGLRVTQSMKREWPQAMRSCGAWGPSPSPTGHVRVAAQRSRHARAPIHTPKRTQLPNRTKTEPPRPDVEEMCRSLSSGCLSVHSIMFPRGLCVSRAHLWESFHLRCHTLFDSVRVPTSSHNQPGARLVSPHPENNSLSRQPSRLSPPSAVGQSSFSHGCFTAHCAWLRRPQLEARGRARWRARRWARWPSYRLTPP